MENEPVITQVCKLVPGHMIKKIVRALVEEAKEQGKKWVYPRVFCYMSHIVSMIYLHITHAQSITEVCDAHNRNKLTLNTIRNAKVPQHNTLSNANRTRSPEIIRRSYYGLLGYYRQKIPGFFERGKHSYSIEKHYMAIATDRKYCSELWDSIGAIQSIEENIPKPYFWKSTPPTPVIMRMTSSCGPRYGMLMQSDKKEHPERGEKEYKNLSLGQKSCTIMSVY